MKKFQIREHGQFFTTIEARTPESALKKAVRERSSLYTSADYDGYCGDVEWRAFEVGGHRTALCRVRVSARGLSFAGF